MSVPQGRRCVCGAAWETWVDAYGAPNGGCSAEDCPDDRTVEVESERQRSELS